MLTTFLDAGGNVVDTAPGYGDGLAEEVIGRALAHDVDRNDLVIVTKGGVRATRSGKVAVDASRRVLLDSLDESLARLGTDHVDLYLVQSPDPYTPMEEIASALSIAVKSGRARYVGLANHAGWQAAQLHGLMGSVGVAAVQNEYSLLVRDAEHDVLPAANGLGLGMLAYSPLGRGLLTGKYRYSTPPDSRAASPHLGGFVRPLMTEKNFGIVESVARAADGMETSPAAIALAWVRERATTAIVGPRTPSQLSQLLDDVVVPPVVLAALDDVSE